MHSVNSKFIEEEAPVYFQLSIIENLPQDVKRMDVAT